MAANTGVQLPPFRSLQDVLTDAQFTLPTINDPERMGNRIINNLIYYQTNYFLLYLVIFLIVGTLYPKDMIIGALAMIIALIIYSKIYKAKQTSTHQRSTAENFIPLAVVAIIVLLMYAMGSVMVFLWGLVTPLFVAFLHAACRKRNLRNKFTNVTDLFKENPSPMAIILNFICEKQEEAERGYTVK
ncbi:hypothetical protein QZH41_014803 [Actinostola sp. cb2023]|nr:hypothetical protein QZH41_014803 [Actinostola sp. cb2023]